MAPKIPPGFHGIIRIIWFEYEELVDDWVARTTEPRQGRSSTTRPFELAEKYKSCWTTTDYGTQTTAKNTLKGFYGPVFR